MLNHYEHVSDSTIAEWVEQFHRDGYLFLPEFLSDNLVTQLKTDLDRELESTQNTYVGKDDADETMRLRVRLFEHSPANLSLFDMDPMAKFAEAVVAPNCHVIHNNSFITRPGGGITTWHQDDDIHYLVTGGAAPINVRLPVLFFTANYYLTDVPEQKYGGTEVIPGSHLFGARPRSWQARNMNQECCPVSVKPAAWCASTTRSGIAVAPTKATGCATSPRSPMDAASSATCITLL
jgi:ectoine hydroxylase-related dioxygenase (phytanoyl-CoA dioxygenase family)